MDRFLAFRVAGDFAWPPLATGNPAESVRGLVEVHYVLDNASTRWIACIRWRAYSTLINAGTVDLDSSEFGTPLNQLDNVYTRTAAQLADFFEAAKNGECALRIDGVAGKPGGARLRFAGCRVLDQFDVPDSLAETPERVVSLRLPLVPLPWKDGSKTWYSTLQVGNANENGTDTSLRLELALPMPLRPNAIQPAAGPFFCAISVLYDTKLQALPAKRPLSFNYLAFGLREKDTKADPLPPSPWLGGFDLSQYRRVSTGAVRWLDANVGPSFWPDSAHVLGHLLPALGFPVVTADGSAPGKRFDTETDLRASRELVAFPGIGLRATGTQVHIEQRFAIAADDDAPAMHDERSALRVRNGDIQLRIGVERHWLSFGPLLYLRATLVGTISDAELWNDEHALSCRLMLGSEQTLKEFDDDPALAAADFGNGVSLPRLLAGALFGMRMARAALTQLQAPQPQSTLPELQLKDKNPTSRHFGVFATVPATLDQRHAVRFEPPPGARYQASLQDGSIFLLPGSTNSVAARCFTFAARWLSFHRDAAGLPIVVEVLHDENVYNDDAAFSETRFFVLRLQNPRDAKSSRQAILGGLALDSSGGTLLTEGQRNHLRIGIRPSVSIGRSFTVQAPERAIPGVNLELNLWFNIGRVEPLAADVPRFDRRARTPPLLLRSRSNSAGSYRLETREEIGADDERRLSATLFEQTAPETEGAATVMLSREPFSLQRIYAQPLQNRGDAENAAVAEYSSDSGVWQFKQVGELYHYVLPPQSIGESMDKPRRLEIHDAVPGAVGPGDDDGDFLRPLPTRNGNGFARRIVEFRLTPPAELWIRPSDVERNYFLPEWASHEIFRQRGELGLGAALAGFRGEFIYGLPVGVTTEAESGPARRARVAEIEALTGRLVDREAGQAGTLNDDRWSKLHQAYQQRPERLEIWADSADGAVAFAPARFEKGARFALRTTALHRAAVDGLGSNDPLGAPFERIPGLSPRLHPQGLSGGALWPVESRNVLDMILKSPESTGGSIEAIGLTSLGGDANQAVRFCNNRVSIITETRNGRVQRQRVEVKGRIGCWWHHAKHVVVYERTASPSAQFTPEGGIGTRTRRPVLRKVSEFIELLQPKRCYPDAPHVPASSNCFVHAMRFNNPVIPVDSLWSEEVGDIGWKIPLWNRDAARQRPQVYPMPDVAYLMASEGKAGDEECPQGCLNPENYFFYADTRVDKTITDDTDKWECVHGVDWINLPPPKHQGDNSAASDGPAKNAARVPPGFERFTWHLAPPSRRTAVNAGRASKPLYAALETLTFMRAARLDDEDGGAATSAKRDALKAADKLRELKPVSALWARAAPTTAGQDDPLSPARHLLNALKLPRIAPTDAAEQDKLAIRITEFGNTFTALASDASARQWLEGELAQFKKGYATLTKDYLPQHDCAALIEPFKAGLRAKRLAIWPEVQAWQAELDRQIDSAKKTRPDYLTSYENLAKYLREHLRVALAATLSGTGLDIGGVRRSGEAARAALTALRADINEGFVRARRELRDVRQSIDHRKPWSKQRLDDFHNRINAVFKRAALQLESAVGDARSRLASDVADLAQRIGAVTARALDAVDKGEGNAVVALQQSQATLDEVQTAIAAALNDLDKPSGMLAQLEKLLSDNGARVPPALAEKINDYLAAAAAHVAAARAKLAEIRLGYGVLAADVDEVTEAAAAVARASIKAVTEATTALETAIKEQSAALGAALTAEFFTTLGTVQQLADPVVDSLLGSMVAGGAWIDGWFDLADTRLRQALLEVQTPLAVAGNVLDGSLAGLLAEVSKVEQAFAPKELAEKLMQQFLPLLDTAVKNIPGFPLKDAATLDDELAGQLHGFIAGLVVQIESLLDKPGEWLDKLAAPLLNVCKTLQGGIQQLEDLAKTTAENWLKRFAPKEELQKAIADIKAVLGDVDRYKNFIRSFDTFDDDVRKVGDQLAASRETARAYAGRVTEAVADIGKGGLLAAPNNILRAMAAIGSTPDLPNLDFARERIAYYYGLVNDVVDTTPVEAWFGRMGDELKALGLSLPFDRISDRLLPVDLSKFDIGRIFRNCGGVELQRLCQGCRLPQGLQDAIRISHDFDKKRFRAWVQVDVDAPLEGRNSLFSLGPFTLDIVNARLLGQVRLEASKDSDRVEQQGGASFQADFEAIVGGQVMVALREVIVSYEKGSGLKVEFDARKIRLNACLQFIQNTLGSIFGDEIGGLKIIKQNGLPVGLEHLFSLPPMSLMFGTSGVQNIQIANRFQLIAYPDFLISNRFSLAKPELPFIFSVFIIGGTGWLTVDVDYKPFGNELMVVVDAGAGGSASLGFAFAGVTGSVAISISVALTYRKLIGRSGGGLTVSLVVLIVGVVDVLRIATAYIGILLRLSYKDNGDIDATGSFRITIRVSRFFKISAGGQARYRMSGGKSERPSSSQVAVEATDPAVAKAAKLLKSQGG